MSLTPRGAVSAPVVASRMLKDREHALAQDALGNTTIWKLTTCSKVSTLKGVSIDEAVRVCILTIKSN